MLTRQFFFDGLACESSHCGGGTIVSWRNVIIILQGMYTLLVAKLHA